MGTIAVCLTAILSGCGDDEARRAAAHAEATARVDRERRILDGIDREIERLRGEQALVELEARLKLGELTPRSLPALLVGDSVAKSWAFRVPAAWVFASRGAPQLLHTWSYGGAALPWYDPSGGILLQRTAADKYSRMIRELQQQATTQRRRIHDAEEYAKLFAPPDRV